MGEPFNFKKQVYLNNYNRDLERFQEGTIEQIKTGGDEETFYYNLKLDKRFLNYNPRLGKKFTGFKEQLGFKESQNNYFRVNLRMIMLCNICKIIKYKQINICVQ